jgi:hypothetical protein
VVPFLLALKKQYTVGKAFEAINFNSWAIKNLRSFEREPWFYNKQFPKAALSVGSGNGFSLDSEVAAKLVELYDVVFKW